LGWTSYRPVGDEGGFGPNFKEYWKSRLEVSIGGIGKVGIKAGEGHLGIRLKWCSGGLCTWERGAFGVNRLK